MYKKDQSMNAMVSPICRLYAQTTRSFLLAPPHVSTTTQEIRVQMTVNDHFIY